MRSELLKPVIIERDQPVVSFSPLRFQRQVRQKFAIDKVGLEDDELLTLGWKDEIVVCRWLLQ